MKKTHTEIIKQIKKLEDEKKSLLQSEEETCTVSYTQGETPIDTGYNYKEIDQRLLDYDKEIRRLKGILARSNATTTVKGFDMSMTEALIYLAQLNAQLARYKTLSERQPLKRESIAYRNSSYEFTKALYDVKEAKEEYQVCFDLISKLQMAIDLTNLTTEVEC